MLRVQSRMNSIEQTKASQMIMRKARSIYEQYVDESAPMQINIPSSQRAHFRAFFARHDAENVAEIDPMFYDALQAHRLNLLRFDRYAPYDVQGTYRDILTSISL